MGSSVSTRETAAPRSSWPPTSTTRNPRPHAQRSRPPARSATAPDTSAPTTSRSKDGAILASKDLIERLDADDARGTDLDPEAIAYTPLGELDGASDKAIRDAGAIPVTAI